MEARPLGPLMTLLDSNQDLQQDITTLEAQMQGLVPGSPEYLYDQLHLELEKEEQKIRAANPNLDPLNPADSKKLDELLAQDPTAQGINREITELSRLFASQVSGWGIPMYDSKTVPTYPT